MNGDLIAPLFNIGPRISAQVLGTGYAQYRASGPSDPTDSGKLVATIPAWITSDAKGMGGRPFSHAKPVCYGMVDPNVVNVGDYLIGNFGTFFVISKDGVMPTQLVRCNKTVTLSRPQPGTPDPEYYGGMIESDYAPILTNWPASVLQGTKGEAGEVKLPGDVRLAWAAVLLPPTGGVEILPGDRITTNEATPMRYTVSGRELTALGWRISAATALV